MGIKGIYKEIGAGRRIALHRLAVESLETRGRPLRLAIDISIWQFQIQAARGGANPAIRTLFYRLVRLLGIPIQPIFVFDGPNKPAFKRNKRSAKSDGTATAMAKRLIRLFGFMAHDAPGEAEAECALLQQRGVVDAVLSEDVDTIMFGCTRTLRNWSSATATTSPPTHVSMYETDSLQQDKSGLDREGMVLVALMSGGDYLPEGIPGCGVKLACQAAKAGFGRSLCRLKRSDTSALASWRANLVRELQTNESRFFRTCHRKLLIPEQFPSLEILRYYTHPVVSPVEIVERVRADLEAVEAADPLVVMRERRVDIPGLRDFVGETFDWTDRAGAIKFIRVLAPSLLSRILLLRWSTDDGAEDGWPSVVKGISKQRTHASTDDTPELRVSFIPATVVSLDLEAENDAPAVAFGRDGLALNSDSDFAEPSPEEAHTTGARKASAYDPTQADVAWVTRAVVEIGAPRAVEAWEKGQKPKAGTKRTKEKAANIKKKTAAVPSMPTGSLDRYVQVTKNAGRDTAAVQGTLDDSEADSESVQPQTARRLEERTRLRRQPPVANPWSLAGSQAPRITKSAVREPLRDCSKVSSVSPPKPTSSVAAVVVDLLSSPEEPRLQSLAKTRRSRAAASPTRSPRKTGVRKTEVTTENSQVTRPPRQKSIRDFLSQPVTVALSSDEEDGVEKEAGGRASETGERSVPPAKLKTVYVPRRSAVGYFREETVEEDGADEKTTGHARRGWRKSEVSIVDLTGLDSD
ncbi:flap structure-specific endonuclease [Grosmannia clavigera kw1407]|uniref:Flap structure-specific endonuclease n=1 Tax=Grosmannia clavigera (strain kw1407 / UAMH 11150) TaxID=655863 RepID=F0XA50_GROCL|nr:flap structure-specific endonuclease [Grosmannia clavigera kw1407]EFX06036.1 flap structure-specific endonuclease [Grosmannia clavigera kw1407]